MELRIRKKGPLMDGSLNSASTTSTSPANAPRASARQAWILLPEIPGAEELGRALAAGGWENPRLFRTVNEVLGALTKAEAGPEVLVTRIRLPDGDAFGLIRRLAGTRKAPGIFLVSRQQHAVLNAALALCDAYGLQVAGHVDGKSDSKDGAAMPDLSSVLPQLEAFHACRQKRLSPRETTARLELPDLEELIVHGGIRAFLQPKVRLRTGQVVGFESLMRARALDGSTVGAHQLIAPLADGGLLPAATLQVFDQTISFLRECRGGNFPVCASVNVPLSLISDLQFCEHIVERVEAAAVDPAWMTLEITESEAMSDPAEVIENAARIRMYGFNLSIDDFGTAYSSFSHLTKIPFSELKIERAFVHGAGSDKAKHAVVAACAQLGRRLGLDVVAEGVESRTDLEVVREAGCTDIQGYLVCRPMAGFQALTWLRELENQRFVLAEAQASH
jgi:EAL domain-containing protein (putative c-di-GMP-specific phosphodiesterase class I)